MKPLKRLEKLLTEACVLRNEQAVIQTRLDAITDKIAQAVADRRAERPRKRKDPAEADRKARLAARLQRTERVLSNKKKPVKVKKVKKAKRK